MMTPKERFLRIKEIEKEYLDRMDELKTQYRLSIRAILKDVNDRKLERLRKELHS
jgi:hypothetical protein